MRKGCINLRKLKRIYNKLALNIQKGMNHKLPPNFVKEVRIS